MRTFLRVGLGALVAGGLLAMVPVTTSAQTPSPTLNLQTDCGTIQQGSRGPCVEIVQVMLNRLGFGPVTVDGVDGPQTTAAVTRFQRWEATGRPGFAIDRIV